MQEANITSIVLRGFPNLQDFKVLFFLVLLIVYCLIISSNLLVIVLFVTRKNLHHPMYFFITQISTCDILLTADVVPNMFEVILKEGATLSLRGCIAQFFFFASSEAEECLLLAVMSYDRYLAICKPLHYKTIVNSMFCVKSVIFTCLLSLFFTLLLVISTANGNFCQSNIIDHFFCDLFPLLELTCSDTPVIHIEVIFIGTSLLICPLTVIVTSYSYIILTILGIPSISGRRKAFSTCSSHLMVVCLFYGSLISVYMVPSKGKFVIVNKILSLSYTVMTPLLNPVIYSLKNKDFMEAFQKMKYSIIFGFKHYI